MNTRSTTGTAFILLSLFELSCAGGGSSHTAPILPGTLTVTTNNAPDGNLFLTYTRDDKEFRPITPGSSIDGLTPGPLVICAKSQIRNITDLYTPYWTRMQANVRSNETIYANVNYQHQYLASGNIQYHISGFPDGAAPLIGRYLTIGYLDDAWVTDSITPSQSVVTVPTAAGVWNIGGVEQDVNGKTYKATPSPSVAQVLPGQTVVVTVAYTLAP